RHNRRTAGSRIGLRACWRLVLRSMVRHVVTVCHGACCVVHRQPRPVDQHSATRRPVHSTRQGGSRWPRYAAAALPKMRLTVVPHTGHLPLAMFMPVLLTSTVPSKSRFSLHFTQ